METLFEHTCTGIFSKVFCLYNNNKIRFYSVMYLLARPDQATQENELELVLYAHEQRRCFPAGSYRASLLEAALWDGCHLFQ